MRTETEKLYLFKSFILLLELVKLSSLMLSLPSKLKLLMTAHSKKLFKVQKILTIASRTKLNHV